LKNQVNDNEESNRILASTLNDVLNLLKLRVANDNTGSGTKKYHKQVDQILSIKNRLKQKGIRVAGSTIDEFHE
jgi:hypothetical protein